jgi:radical SAM protein with 4Fe4S-binding SPASM domain
MMTPEYLVKDLTVEITKKCPMRCTICSSEGGACDPAELSLAELCKVVDDAKQLGATTISLSGGEPLESPHAIDFIRYVKNSDLELHLYTCGNLYSENQIYAIKERTFRLLKDLNVDKIIFSIHGPNAEIHEKITTIKGSFENLITSIKRAREYDHTVELHFVPVLSNFEFIPQTCFLAKELGIRQLSILRFVPQGRGKENRHNLEITGMKIRELEKILEEIHRASPIQLRFGAPFNCFNIDNRTKCSAGIDKAILRPDGFLFPCVSLKKTKFTTTDNDIRKGSFDEIWNNSEIFSLIRSFHDSVKKSNCRNCDFISFCGGGCITQRMIDSNDLSSSKDPFCSYDHHSRIRSNINQESIARKEKRAINGS